MPLPALRGNVVAEKLVGALWRVVWSLAAETVHLPVVEPCAQIGAFAGWGPSWRQLYKNRSSRKNKFSETIYQRIWLPKDLFSYWGSVFQEDLFLYNSSLGLVSSTSMNSGRGRGCHCFTGWSNNWRTLHGVWEMSLQKPKAIYRVAILIWKRLRWLKIMSFAFVKV